MSQTPVWLELDEPLLPQQVEAVARCGAPLALGPQAIARARRGAQAMREQLQRGERVYGVTTGFGPLASTHLDASRGLELQRHLIHHLSAGVGPPLDEEATRAIMVARASALMRGFSGVDEAAASALAAWLERGLTPVVPSLGSVGASGDLTPLAHMALAMLGDARAQVRWRGQRLPAPEGIARAGAPTLTLTQREGLALVNGTSAMTGLAALNDARLRRALGWSLGLTLLVAEVLGGHAQAWSLIFARARPHPGQRWAVERLHALAQRSPRLRQGAAQAARGSDQVQLEQPLLQDAYSIRCAPQLLGALYDAWRFHHQIVCCELVSATDNPLLDPDQALVQVVHGGNFFGQHVSMASDALLNAAITLMAWSERKVARLCDPSLSGLPPFLTPMTPGLHSGLMGAQVTATSLVAWARAHASAASIQSISTNNHNQDVVPMGTIAALRLYQLMDRLYESLAIEGVAAVQAATLLAAQEARGLQGFSASSQALIAWVRARVCPLQEDRPLGAELSALAEQMAQPAAQALLDQLEGVCEASAEGL